MKMNRCILLVLPLLFLLSSCGTTAQFAQQRFQDGIYSRPEPVAEAVQIYSKDDFAAMAAANIAREAGQKDTVYVVIDDYDWYDSPWFAWSSAWAFSWPYRHWAFSGWYSPWYGWGCPWYYDPWYSWYYDPWFYDPWYYDPWYYHPHHYWPNYQPPRPGLSSDGRYFYGPRRFTQGGGSMVSRPGSSSGYNYTRSYTSAGGNYGSAGASSFRRGGSQGSVSGSSVRPSGSSTSGGTVSRPGGNYNYSRSYSNSQQNNSNSYFNNNRNGNINSYQAPSPSRSPSFSAPSRSYGGGSMGGGSAVRSGGGGNYSRGRR